MKTSRRSFVKKTAALGSAAIIAPTILPGSVFEANDRINAAVLGLHGRGKNHIQSLMVQDDVEVTILCDPDVNILKEREKESRDTYNKEVVLEQDLCRVMDNRDIDVLSIASPNHRHALSVTWAILPTAWAGY